MLHYSMSKQSDRLKQGLCSKIVYDLGWFGKGCWLTLLGIVLPYLLKLLCKFNLYCTHY